MYKQAKSFLRRIPYLTPVFYALRKAWRDFGDLYETYVPLSLRSLHTFNRYGLTLRAGISSAHRAIQAGEFETDEIAIVQAQLAQAHVFVDVGANIGLYACLARLAGKHTIAIEPQQKNLSLLYDNLNHNGHGDLEVYPVGLSNRPGLGRMYGLSGTGASLIKGWASQAHSQGVWSTIPLTTLDVLIGERFSEKKLLIKVDVEGAEYAVLGGAGRTLSMNPRPTWLVEICLNEYHPNGFNPDYAATFELFWKYGYKAHTADSRFRLIEPADVQRWVNASCCDSGVINYLFTPS